jgi:magnesium chelatase subunit D
MREAKAAVLSLLLDSYQRRDKVALVAFRGEGAEVVLPPTASVEVAAARLRQMPTGGRTPLAAGLALAARILAAEALRDPARRPLVVLVTDGRATGGADPMGEALRAASHLAGLGAPALVVDAEEGPVRLGFARGVARALAAPCVRLEELRSVGRVVRAGRGAA